MLTALDLGTTFGSGAYVKSGLDASWQGTVLTLCMAMASQLVYLAVMIFDELLSG